MKRLQAIIASSLFAVIGGFSAYAGENYTFKFTPQARLLLDGAVFLPNKDDFSDGVYIPDARIGANASYGNISMTLSMAYFMGKFKLMDAYFMWKPNSWNTIKAGHFINQFGLNAATSSSRKASLIAPISDTFFGVTPYNFGINYIYSKNEIFAAGSVFTPATSLSEQPMQQGKISMGVMERFAWRPLREKGNIAQIGFSSLYQTPEHKAEKNEDGVTVASEGFLNYSANYPTKVNSISLLKAPVTHAKGAVKISPEILLSKDRFALEGQYYFMNVDRGHGFGSYKAQGAYGLFRALLIGEKEYSYSSDKAYLNYPGSKTLECILGYDYTNASDCHSAIMGGISNDWSVTFNYYLNKYFNAQLRYSYTDVRASEYVAKRHENIIQARLIFIY
ncbi:MAG: hypothetical protein HDS97_05285 [Bacteroidales bacterium]|nr:hypothetical protein [Bacteroidales bacterium]